MATALHAFDSIKIISFMQLGRDSDDFHNETAREWERGREKMQ